MGLREAIKVGLFAKTFAGAKHAGKHSNYRMEKVVKSIQICFQPFQHRAYRLKSA